MISKSALQALRASSLQSWSSIGSRAPMRGLCSAAPTSPARYPRSTIQASAQPGRLILTRAFSSTRDKKAKNRMYTSVRNAADLQTYILSSTSSRTPLITFWTASYCPTCRTILPLLESLISSGVGEEEGGVAYCEVEFDAPDVMDSGLAMQYMITGLPTLLSFDRGEVMDSRTTDPKLLRDERWLKEWIRSEAKRRGGGTSGGVGGSLGGSLFGGLFGSKKS